MYREDSGWVVRPTDLVNFLECGRLAGLAAAEALAGAAVPSVESADVKVLRRRGLELTITSRSRENGPGSPAERRAHEPNI